MRFWQHLCIWVFMIYMAICATTAISGYPERAGVGVVLLLVGLSLVLGPAACAALIVDIWARSSDRETRTKWLLVCLLCWPAGIYYYFTHGFLPVPARPAPPPQPVLPPALPGAAAAPSPPPLRKGPQNSAVAGKSLMWGGISLVSIVVPLALPACFVGIFYGHKGLNEVRASDGRLEGRGIALLGLALSYGSLMLTCLMIYSLIHFAQILIAETNRNSSDNLAGDPGYTAAREAERCMDDSSCRGGDGNSAEARRLAAELSKAFVVIQKHNFVATAASPQTRTDSPPFLYCYLREDSCAVIFNLSIPVSLNQKETHELNSVLWAEVHEVLAAKSTLEDGSRLAVAVRGGRKYSEMFWGEFDGPPENENDIPEFESPENPNTLDSKKTFYAYFANKVLPDRLPSPDKGEQKPVEEGQSK